MAGDCAVQCSGKIAPWPKRQMSDLSCTWIHLNKMCVSSICFQHEVKTMQAGKIETPSDYLSSSRHLSVLNKTQDCRVAYRLCFVENFKMKTREDSALPASHCTGRFTSCHKGLGIHYGSTTKQRGLQ